MADKNKFYGALVGAACGDALGYPMRNFSSASIQRRFGPFGLRTLVMDVKNGKKAPVSDNTQLMLATVDGILWADAKKLDILEATYRSYMRWFYSQTGEEPRRGQRTWLRRQSHEREFCLVHEKFMHAKRNPEEGLLSAFSRDVRGTTKVKVNDSKGSAALLRAVPVGLLFAGDEKMAFDTAVKLAALSHSNPAAYYVAGAVGALISCLTYGMTLPKALERMTILLSKAHKSSAIMNLLTRAVQTANNQPAGKNSTWDHVGNIEALGSGAQADEALAIALYTVLAIDDPMEALIAAANHGGKSHTTAALVGAIEGARFGNDYLPGYWSDILEGYEADAFLADKLFYVYKKFNP